ncbi:MAG: hypothetical protein AABW62_05900, partial [Thermoproteota archaeon]
MYSTSKEEGPPPPDAGKYIRIGIVAVIGIVIFAIVGNQAVILSMNITEFDDKFTKPLFYSVVSAVTLGIIALVRVSSRSSITWYGIRTAITLLSKGTHESVTSNITSFKDYKLSVPHFV